MAQQFPQVNVVGLGAQDNLAQAQEFVASTGTGGGEIQMIWDPSFDSWRQLGIRSQPYWMLYDATGKLVFSQPGAVNIDAVRDVVS